MLRSGWFARVAAGVLAVGGLLYCAGMLAGFFVAPEKPFAKTSLGKQTVRVTRVDRQSAAARLGIVEGQVLRYATRRDQIADVLPFPGTTVHYAGMGGGRVAVTYEARTLSIGEDLRLIAQALLAIIALLIVFRAWHDPQARRLAVLFAVLANYVDAVTLPATALLPYLVLAWLCAPWAIIAFARFGTGYPSTPPRLRSVIRVAAVVAGLAYFVSLFLSVLPAFGDLPAGCWALVALLGLIGLIASFVRATGVERRRIGWVLVSFAVGLGPIVVYEGYVFATGAPEVWTWQAIPFLAIPLGMTYATLRLRVIDLGFALTRAGVFSVMTLLVAGVFGILESLADKVFSQASHTESLFVELSITLVLVYLVRYFHHHVEHAIERFIFAARNRRIKLITSIANSLGMATAPQDVSNTLVARLRTDAEIPATVYVAESGTLRYDAGDPGLHPDDANDVHAFPLETFGRNRGVLVCRLLSDDEFAPDEAAALTELARSAAGIRESARVDSLAAELAAANAELQRLQGVPRVKAT